jgi:hypothetical protein
MFEPFVLDGVASMDADAVTGEQVRETIRQRHQLALPLNTLRTLLGRAQKQGYVHREGGRYFRTDKRPEVGDLLQERTRVEERQARLAHALREYSADRGVEVQTTEDAMTMLLDFLDQYHVALALGEDDDGGSTKGPAGEGSEDASRKTVATAAFLRDTVVEGGELADVVQEMLEGFVLQNALLLKDISTATRRFNDLHVIFDSGLLFGALGMRGSATETATRELIALLKDTGAVLDVFEPTVREMRRILAVYEDRIGTSEGRASLYQTELTRHFLTTHATPSDIRTKSSLIEREIRKLGFNVRERPARQAEFTLDEKDLATRLAERPGAENVPRVVHDVDCVAGVLSYRRGQTSESLDNARAVFVTSSGLPVQHTCRWYREQGGAGFRLSCITSSCRISPG